MLVTWVQTVPEGSGFRSFVRSGPAEPTQDCEQLGKKQPRRLGAPVGTDPVYEVTGIHRGRRSLRWDADILKRIYRQLAKDRNAEAGWRRRTWRPFR